MKNFSLLKWFLILGLVLPSITWAAQLYVVGENKIGVNGDVLVTIAVDSVTLS